MDQLARKEVTPNLLITTSHNPSHFLRRVGKLLSFIIPNSEKLSRGSLNFHQISNYCWNKEIKLLFILDDSESKNSAFLKLYDFTNSRTPINAIIRLMNFSFPNKGNSRSRIEFKGTKLVFSDLKENRIYTKIQEVMKSLQMSCISRAKHPELIIDFQKISSSQVHGIVTREYNEEILPVLSFEVTLPRD
ncbi:MAG: hypothetical protein ACXACP_05630 [Candidatus Hodarchaeales archaeon]|jgi:rRNA maturation protein Rpf1